MQHYSIGINILSPLFRYCYLFSKYHCPNNHNILYCFVLKLWFIKGMRKRTGCVYLCFSTFISSFLPKMLRFFLTSFPFYSKNCLWSIYKSGCACIMIIHLSIFILPWTPAVLFHWFMDDTSLHSVLLTFMASDKKSGDTWFGVSYMEYLLLLFNCYEDYPPLFSSLFECLTLYFWVCLLEWHCGSHLAS